MLPAFRKPLSLIASSGFTLLLTGLSATAQATAVGYINGELSVGGGVASYSVPVAVPPGVAGMEPTLSFNYSSQGGGGQMGTGWGLGGLSAVSRCGLSLVQDGQNRGIKFDGNDNYCLDGQRLIPISGTKGQSGTEYRTELDGYSRIISYGSAGNGPAYFKVWTKSGQIMEYGVTGDSRIEAQGKSSVLTWTINKISDTAGNDINFRYTETHANTEYVLDYITYGPGQANKVDFDYVTKASHEINTHKLAGSTLKSSKRLKTVKTFAGGTEVQGWTFDYAVEAGKSTRMTAMEVCAAGDCLPKTQFEWTAESSKEPYKKAVLESHSGIMTDLNGDGISEFSSSGYNYKDVNGDGLQDRVSTYSESQKSATYWTDNGPVYLSCTDRLGARVELGRQTGGFASSTVWASVPINVGQCDRTVSIYVEDVTGDGRADLVTSDSAVYISNGSTFTGGSQTTYQMLNPLRFPDINGDGWKDIAYNCSGKKCFRFSNGNGTFSSLHKSDGIQVKTWTDDNGFYNAPYKFKPLDINGDGLEDLYYENGYYYLSKGDGFESASFDSNYVHSAGDCSACEIGDIDGDGIPDLRVNATYVRYGQKSENAKLKRILNNTTTEILYQDLNTSIHDTASSFSFPEVPLRGGMDVVSEVITDDGIGGTKSTTYRYGGAKAHRTGRGMLGFAWTEETDESTGTMVRAEYRQDFPYIGMLKKSETRLHDGTLINRTENNYGYSRPTHSKVYFPYIERATEYSYERNGSLITTVLTENLGYDSYGNAERIKVTTTGGGKTFVTETDNQYDNNVSSDKWHLGRLSRSDVTHTGGDGRIATRSTAFGYHSTFGFLNEEIVEPDAIDQLYLRTAYEFDSYGNKTKVTTNSYQNAHGAPRQTQTVYTANGQFPQTTTNALGHQSTVVYDSKYGVVTSQTGPNGIPTTWDYDSFGNKTAEHRYDNTSSQIERRWIGSCPHSAPFAEYCVIARTDGSADKEVYFDSLNRQVRSITLGFDGRTVYSDTEYNALGQVHRVSRPYYAGERPYWATSIYDDMGRVVEAHQPGVYGGDSSIGSSYNGLTTISTNEKGHTKTTVTNAIGKIVSVTEEDGASQTYTYDPLGNLEQTTDSAGNVSAIQYDIRGRKTSMNDPDMGVWSYIYNAYGELKQQTDAKLQVSSMTYDTLGRMKTRSEGEGVTTWHYDDATNGAGKGKLDYVTGPNGFRENYFYDNLGRLERTETVAEGKTLSVSNAYDAYGRVQYVTRPNDFVTENVYNNLGYLESVRSPRADVPGYQVSHLTNLLTTAVSEADSLISEASSQMAKADNYFASAKMYLDQIGVTDASSQALVINSSHASLSAGSLIQLLKDSSGIYHFKQAASDLSSGKFMVIAGDINIVMPVPVFRYFKLVNGVVTEVTDSLQNPGFGDGLSSTRTYAYINSGNVSLLSYNGNRTNVPDIVAVAEALKNAAGQLTSAAKAQLDQAEALILAAETEYRQALLAGYWAPDNNQSNYNDYQALVSDSDYVYYWQAKEVDASGRIGRELYGNGLSNVYNYDPANGLLLNQQTGFAGFDLIRDLEYQYDALNNIIDRYDHIGEMQEHFEYDRLDRLIESTVSSNNPSSAYNKTISYDYDTLGNITHKSDVGAYSYDGINAGPHAVTQAGVNSYSYDANGNMLHGAGRSIQWTSFNKPRQISKDGKTVNFTYGPGRSRYLKETTNGNKTLYLGKLYEYTYTESGAEETHKQFIYAGSQLVSVHSSGKKADGNAKDVQTRYMHKDNLGSVDTITDGMGNVVEKMSFDPFGARRPSDWRDNSAGASLIPLITNRGFTGHETIDEVDLIHMNGRVYDATLGRFLSADPHVQSPYNTQSYNRYSYVMNNPLKYTDPSGHFFSKLASVVRKVTRAARRPTDAVLRKLAGIPVLNAVVTIGICVATAGTGCPYALAAYSAAQTYAVTGDFGASLKAGAISYASAYFSGKVGAKWEAGSFQNALGNGIVQGTTSKLQGGKFGDGFFSAAFSAYMKPQIFDTFGKGIDATSTFKRVFAAGAIGGTVSVIGGGKFANGAISSAFSQMLNGEQTLRKAHRLASLTRLIAKGASKFERWIRRPSFNDYVDTDNRQCANARCLITGAAYDQNTKGLKEFELAQKQSVLRVAAVATAGHSIASSSRLVGFTGVGIAFSDDMSGPSNGMGTTFAISSIGVDEIAQHYLPGPFGSAIGAAWGMVPVFAPGN